MTSITLLWFTSSSPSDSWVSNDSIAKAYIEDSKNDFNRYLLCKEAESLINNLYIDEALENLLECSKSDFNLIEVNNLLALAYMKKGEYDNSIICLKKVLMVDKKNTIAKESPGGSIDWVWANEKSSRPTSLCTKISTTKKIRRRSRIYQV